MTDSYAEDHYRRTMREIAQRRAHEDPRPDVPPIDPAADDEDADGDD